MEGPSIHDAELAGVIPRTVREIFFAVEEAPDSLEFVIKVSGGGSVYRRVTRSNQTHPPHIDTPNEYFIDL